MSGRRPIRWVSGTVILLLALGACAAPRAEDIGDDRSGEPVDRDAWEALADELDADARAALDHPRPGR